MALLRASLLPLLAHACGFTVHMLNTHRALTTLASTPRTPSFMPVLEENLGAVFAGSPYPDYLYACGPNHDDGEYTHWSPFQAIAAEYIRTAYPEPRNATGRALVAFIAGVASHYMADISWHGLAETPSGYGLIETVGVLDFKCDGSLCSVAHTFSDTGGEFAAVYENAVPWDDPVAWVIPVQDLLRIYAMANRSDVTASAIQECALIFFAGAEAVAAAAALADPILEQASPTFAETISTMPLGGWSDMSIMIGRIWARLATWIERGPPSPVPGHEYCNEQNPCAPHSREALIETQAAFRAIAPYVLSAGLVTSHQRGDGSFVISRATETPHALLGAVADGLRALDGGRLPERATSEEGGWTAPTPSDADAHVVARRVSKILGVHRSLSTNASAVAAALDARAAVFDARAHAAAAPSSPLPPPAPVDFAAAGTVALEYAGNALAAGDFDCDGALELIITAYGTSPTGQYVDDAVGVAPTPNGAIGVLPEAGGWYTRSPTQSAPSAAQLGDGPEPLLPSARTDGASVYARLGESACALDFNGDGVDDLAVGARTAGWAFAADPWDETPLMYYQGAVAVYFGRRGVGLPPASAPDVVIRPTQNLSFFGAVLSCDADVSGDGLRDLLIGSPQWGPETPTSKPSQRGRVDVFFAAAQPPPPATLTIDDANATFLGDAPFAWAGASVSGWANASSAGVTRRESFRAALGARAGETDADAAARVCAACTHLVESAAREVAADERATAAAALVLVGSPGFSPSGTAPPYASVTGRLSAYVVPASSTAAGALAACIRAGSKRVTSAATPLFSITADANLGVTSTATPKLGASVAVGRPLGAQGGAHVAVGMPDVDFCNSTALLPGGADTFKTAAGAVGVFPLSPSLRGDTLWSALPSRAKLLSALPDARFGLRVGFFNALNKSEADADDLWVGAPHYTRLFFGGDAAENPAPTPAGDSGREVGAVFAFRGGADFLSGTVCAAETQAAWWGAGAAEHGRLGGAWAYFDWNGDGEREVVVAAPRSALVTAPARRSSGADATAAEHAGVLQVYRV